MLDGCLRRDAGRRVEIEAALDFPDEDIEILAQAKVSETLDALSAATASLLAQAEQGRRLAQGITVALVGKPNVGKSSILNALAGEEAAIVTDVPGTTRDLLKVDVNVGGIPLQLVDTAGLRDTEDAVELIGVQRALEQIQRAEHIVLVVTAADLISNGTQLLAFQDLGELLKVLGFEAIPELAQVAVDNIHLLVNKIDLVEVPEQPEHAWPVSYVSAKTGVGLQAFTKSLVEQSLGSVEGTAFTARLRHVQSLELVQGLLLDAKQGFSNGVGAELIAEDCQLAHQALGQIVGTVSADDLLGEIFSSFCIGK